MNNQNNVIFREEQRFRQLWLWLTAGSIAVVIPAIFIYGIIRQIGMGQPFGDRPMSDTALIVTGIVAGFLSIGIAALFWYARLITEVRRDGLHLRFIPFHRRWINIPFENVAGCAACTYKPLIQYGGWGIRRGLKGKAYNVSGNLGVQLDFVNGKHLLIGSQKPEELAQAISQMRDSNIA